MIRFLYELIENTHEAALAYLHRIKDGILAAGD